MRRIPLAGAACAVACLVFVFASAPASAAPITGKLDTAGYTVIALAANGQARTVIAGDGNFSLEPPAETATLHLRAPDGTYAGPVVLREQGGEVAEARSTVKSAKRKVRRAKRKVRTARTRVARADDAEAEERASKRLRRAKRRLKKAKRRLTQAKALLEQAEKLEAGRPNRAILGIRSGAALGPIQVRSSAGYAITRPIGERWLDTARVARARDGVPIGAGVFGRVVSPHLPSAVPGDADVDGVPNALDIDDDGDLILDNIVHSTGAQAAQAEFPGGPMGLSSGLEQIRLDQTVNANAASLTVSDIDEILKTLGRLQLVVLSGDASPNSPELDCGGLIYCSPGGTGKRGFTGSPPPPFPECCDPDGDGFGTMTSWNGVTPDFFIAPHGATTEQIGTGDVLIERVTRGGVEIQFTGTLQFVFATIPALVSYNDTAGNCAKVSGTAASCATEFSYPVPPPGSDCSLPGCPGGPGTEGNGFPVAPGPNGEMEVTFTFWRPQRTPIPPETAQWIDIGGLNYVAAFGCNLNDPSSNPTCGNKSCPPDAYSVPAGSELATTTLPNSAGALKDSAPDRPTTAQNTFTYTVDLSECLRDPRTGFGNDTPLTWNPGEERQLVFQGTNLLDRSEQIIYFKRQ